MLFEKIDLESSEAIIKVVRKHWFIIVSELFGVFLMVLLPFVCILFFLMLPELIPSNINLSNYSPLIAYAISIWLLLSIMTGFMIWTHYYLDLWVVTDRRIIVIDQINFFNRKVSSFRLERLQDIKVAVNGILATFLNFGTIRAQTAGAAENNFTSTDLPDPRGLQATIQKATDARLEHLHRNQPAGLTHEI
jgi:hypothetical protein